MAQALPGAATQGSLLDVGCGTGALLVATRARYSMVVGCDVAFRWLVVARKRLQEAGMEAPLVCCCADHLPFADEAFRVVTAFSLLEHLPGQQDAALRESHRILRRDGQFLAVSANRYSLAPEPHVSVWGVGFLPRRWMEGYVRWRRGLTYDKFRLLSPLELRQKLRQAGFREMTITVPPLADADLEGHASVVRLAARLFFLLTQVPVLGWPLRLFSPLIQAAAWKR